METETDELEDKLSIFMVAHALTKYLDASEDMQRGVEDMARIITSETADADDQDMARNTLSDWLWPQPTIDLETMEEVPEK